MRHKNSNSRESLKEKPKRFNMNEIFKTGATTSRSNNSSRRSSNRSSFAMKENSLTPRESSSKKVNILTTIKIIK